jgi:transposase
VRDRLVQRRTALINEMRGFLLERGLVFAAGPIQLRKNLPSVIEDAEQNLSPRLRWLLDRLWQEWKQTEIDIKTITDELERISNEDARCRLQWLMPVVFTAGQHGPGDASQFVGDRDHDLVARSTLGEPVYPLPESSAVVFDAKEHGAGTVDQHASQIHIAALAHAEQLLLTPG